MYILYQPQIFQRGMWAQNMLYIQFVWVYVSGLCKWGKVAPMAQHSSNWCGSHTMFFQYSVYIAPFEFHDKDTQPLLILDLDDTMQLPKPFLK